VRRKNEFPPQLVEVNNNPSTTSVVYTSDDTLFFSTWTTDSRTTSFLHDLIKRHAAHIKKLIRI
jgi:hypothetical protein